MTDQTTDQVETAEPSATLAPGTGGPADQATTDAPTTSKTGDDGLLDDVDSALGDKTEGEALVKGYVQKGGE